MPKRKIEFINGEIYHIIIRGVEKRMIFMNDQDYWRGVFSLYEFNSEESVVIREKRKIRSKKNCQRPGLWQFFRKKGQKAVG